MVQCPQTQTGFEEEDVSHLVQEQSGDVDFNRAAFDLLAELLGFFHKLFATRLEPLDENRGVNDDLCAHTGDLDSNE